jgi:osmotically-inducible protein OsmY
MMRHKMHNCFLFLFAVAILLVCWGCVTARSAGIENREATMEATPQLGDNVQYTGERMDANLSSAIRMKFSTDDLLSGSDINVDTTNGNVTLNGKVDTQAEANRAMRLGRSVDGVRSVRSSLIVKTTT